MRTGGSVVEVELLRVHQRPEGVLKDDLTVGWVPGDGGGDGLGFDGGGQASEDTQEKFGDDLVVLLARGDHLLDHLATTNAVVDGISVH